MQYTTLTSYPNSGTLNKFTTLTTSDGGILRTYYPAETIRFRLVIPTFGKPMMYTKAALETFEIVTDCVDKAGVSILPDGIGGYEIQTVLPNVNVMGYVDGYRYQLSKVRGVFG